MYGGQMRILVAMMKHETNTLSPIPTSLDRFFEWGGHLFWKSALAHKPWPGAQDHNAPPRLSHGLAICHAIWDPAIFKACLVDAPIPAASHTQTCRREVPDF